MEGAGSRRGRLLVFEGIDGCGKTTQALLLAERIGALSTFEPGATSIGRRLRALLLEPGLEIAERAEALMMIADRAQHVAEVIEPALASGQWVVSDRFTPSTLAYQGYGRGLPVDELRQIASWSAGSVKPDVTVLVDVSVSVARRRLKPSAADRLERLDEAFHTRVHDGYLALASVDPKSWLVVDGDAPAEEVAGRIRSGLLDILGTLPDGSPGSIHSVGA